MYPIHRTLIASALSIAAAGASAQNLVANGSFEDPYTSYVGCFANTTLGGWSSSGAAESCYLSNNLPSPWPDAVEGTQFMYLGQNMTANVTLSQSVMLEAGTAYVLSFSLAGLGAHPGGEVLVSVAGQFGVAFATPDDDSTWRRYHQAFGAATTGPQLLSFVSPTGGVINIDDVRIVAATPVPEPAAALLALLGMPLVLWARRRQAS
jgi:Protein of unknown function (DUF642)